MRSSVVVSVQVILLCNEQMIIDIQKEANSRLFISAQGYKMFHGEVIRNILKNSQVRFSKQGIDR